MNTPNRKPAGRNRRLRPAQAPANRRIAGQKATNVTKITFKSHQRVTSPKNILTTEQCGVFPFRDVAEKDFPRI